LSDLLQLSRTSSGSLHHKVVSSVNVAHIANTVASEHSLTLNLGTN